MINFTDMTGLAGSVITITAMVIQLPGVVRLQRNYFAILVCAIAIIVLFPLGGLPLAAYVRGWMGDLSITSLVLLILTILRLRCVPSPNGVTSLRVLLGLKPLTTTACPLRVNLAAVFGSLVEWLVVSSRGLGRGNARGKYTSFSIITLAALSLYPMALGIGYFDPYRLGYGNPWFIGGLLLVTLASFRQFPVMALTIALAVLAWGVGWYESTNLWDYLLDPLLAIYAFSVLVRHGTQIVLKSQRG